MTKNGKTGSQPEMAEPGNSDATIEAIRAAGAAYPPEGEAYATGQDVDTQAVEDALTDRGVETPVFSTHSDSMVGEFAARLGSIKAQAAEVRSKIALLEAEYTDLMLTASMLSHGMQAREAGRQ